MNMRQNLILRGKKKQKFVEWSVCGVCVRVHVRACVFHEYIS